MEVSDKLHALAALPLTKTAPGTHWNNLTTSQSVNNTATILHVLKLCYFNCRHHIVFQYSHKKSLFCQDHNNSI